MDDTRKKALLEKKKRLEEMKARRAIRQTAEDSNKNNNKHQEKEKEETNKKNLDDYIDNLLSTTISVPPPAAAAANDAPRPPPTTTTTTHTATNDTEKDQETDETAVEATVDKYEQEQEMMMTRKTTRGVVETFEVAIQTENFDDNNDNDDRIRFNTKEGGENNNNHQEEEEGFLVEEEDETEEMKVDDTTTTAQILLQSKKQQNLLKSLNSPIFAKFLAGKSKVMEKSLSTDMSLIYRDYACTHHATTNAADNIHLKNTTLEKVYGNEITFHDNQWVGIDDRMISSIDFSPFYSELIVASYISSSSSSTDAAAIDLSTTTTTMNNNSDHHHPPPPAASIHRYTSHEALEEGLVLVWSTSLNTRPEYVFTCSSPITAVKFHPTEPHLIVGGSKSGQLFVWDTRAGRLPVQKSVLYGNAHSYPICALENVESGLVTASIDGKVNFWSLTSLLEPAESINIKTSISKLAVVADTGSILCVDEWGGLTSILPPSSSSSTTATSTTTAGSAAGSNSNIATTNSTTTTTTVSTTSATGASRRVIRSFDIPKDQAHFGMVTDVSVQNSFSKNNKSNSAMNSNVASISKGFQRGTNGGLVLTSGIDWTTKLWAPAYTDEPLLTFLSHSYDYMNAVAWNPNRSSSFVSATCNGTLTFWNLSNSLDEPVFRTSVVKLLEKKGIDNNQNINNNSRSSKTLTQLKWSVDGSKLAIAIEGGLHILDGFVDEISGSGSNMADKEEEQRLLFENLQGRGLLIAK